MSHQLIDRSEDLRRLRDEGYNLGIVGANLVVSDVPYVNERREVKYDGVLISTLNLSGEIVNAPRDDHTMRFSGDYPCTSEGKRIDAIHAGSEVVRYGEKLIAQHRFSSKPRRGYYESYYEKVRTYAAILSGPACVIDSCATAQTRRVIEPEEDDSPFQYLDSASGRAEISIITQKLAAERVAIVGVGGTGSYVLDFLAKTPVKEIHLFDGDTFASHNAFRAPGAASIEDLHRQQLKVDYLKSIYSRMHKGIVLHGEDVDASNVDQLRGMSSVFLCIDASPEKKFIVGKLEEFGGTFIDTGMGLYAKEEKLGGILRVTTSEPANRSVARARMSFVASDGPNEYDKNIQVADLNALNAILAVIRWKKMRGFYFDLKHERFSAYTIGGNLLLNEDLHEQD